MTTYIGIDIETSGKCMRTNFIVAIGAFAVLADGTELQRFYVALQPPTINHTFEKRCMDEFWSKNIGKLEKFQRDALPIIEALSYFIEWLNKCGDNLIFVTDFAEYDIAWINMYLAIYMNMPPLYMWTNKFSQAVNVDDVYRGDLKQSGWGVTKKIADKYGFKMEEETHYPDEDARAIVLNYVRYLEFSGQK